MYTLHLARYSCTKNIHYFTNLRIVISIVLIGPEGSTLAWEAKLQIKSFQKDAQNRDHLYVMIKVLDESSHFM